MSKVNIVRRCANCGALLQSEHPEQDGYIERKSLLETPLDRVLFCEECYKESGFSLESEPLVPSSELITMMEDARASDSLIVYIINAFSFEASFVSEINEIIKNNPLLVLANKGDLFKGLVSDEDLQEYVAHRFRVYGIPLQKESVMPVSLAFFSSSSHINEEINKRRRGHDVYVISSRGAGKSAFFSSFLYSYTNSSFRPVETSLYPDTKAAVMKIPLDASSTLFDTVPLDSENDINAKLEKSVSDSLSYFSKIASKKMSIEKNSLVSLGAISFIELLSYQNESDEIQTFFSPSLLIKKSKTDKSGIEKTVQKIIDKRGFTPKSGIVRSFKDLAAYDIEIEEKGDRSIGIEGLGWFSFLGNGQTYRLYVPKGVSVYTGRSKIETYGNISKK